MNIIDFINASSISLIAVLTPIILALVEVFKRFMDTTRWAPVISIGIGILLAYFFSGLETVPFRILLGVLSGLSASGLYSSVKRVAVEG